MRHSDVHRPTSAHTVQDSTLSPTERDVLATPEVAQFQRQSRWLPDVALSHAHPLGVACRRIFDACTLRDVADSMRDCDSLPNPQPDDVTSLLIHLSGTLGAKQALLAALATECGRTDVQLMLACHELALQTTVESNGRRPVVPIVVCFLRCHGRDIQIADAASGSVRHSRALSAVSVEPRRLAAERLKAYQSFAADWCRALDIEPAEFTRLRAQALRTEVGPAVIEDLLGHRLPPEYSPSL
jgi:hypothetical protein